MKQIVFHIFDLFFHIESPCTASYERSHIQQFQASLSNTRCSNTIMSCTCICIYTSAARIRTSRCHVCVSRVCSNGSVSRMRRRVSVSESRERIRGLCGCVMSARCSRVSHQQLMAGATQLVVTGAFARASLSLAAYQLLATRKRPERMSCRAL